ncbi:Fibronectin type III domain protein [Dissulfuribacter thermophilus]|uniref:Fibronectin type III domain protein n=1 Tax=Dissulfuribacter thermophilus TaxID=1156395 RepID=A0A1B9F578_9BACT|nr:putative Ig domain-containing protein [Dissulfuribacter thermophilus]OCC15086.1 Fibronectin type III domain protein [Dissulfuribacter thermophilus]
MHKKNGFTLIEMAIVLVIIGLLVGMGTGLLKILIKKDKISETRGDLKTVYNAILGYTKSTKRLPANLNVLGVKTKDAYNEDFLYFVASGMTSSDLCTTKGSYLTVLDKGVQKSNVAFIVFSKGENHCNQTGNSTSAVFRILQPGTMTSGCPQGQVEYDDEVRYADINTLRDMVCNPFKIVTEILPYGMEEYQYPTSHLEATDGTPPYSWSIVSGHLPQGLNLDNNGTISGIPIEDGTFNFTVQVKDAEGRTATRSLSITINPNDPVISTLYLNYGIVNHSYSAVLGASGGKEPYKWHIKSGSRLPLGLSLNGNTISGTPTQSGTYSFTIKVRDARGRTTERTLSIAINDEFSGSTNSNGSGSGSGSGNNGSGNQACNSYTLTIIQAAYSGDYIESMLTDRDCVDLRKKQFNKSFTLAPQTIRLYKKSDCRASSTVSRIDLVSADSDGDCKVYILCNGDKDKCQILNSAKVYCWKAKFETTNKKRYLKISSSNCKKSKIINGPNNIRVFPSRSDCRSNKNQLCEYNFNTYFQLSEDKDLDCRVKIDDNCNLSND